MIDGNDQRLDGLNLDDYTDWELQDALDICNSQYPGRDHVRVVPAIDPTTGRRTLGVYDRPPDQGNGGPLNREKVHTDDSKVVRRYDCD